MTDNSVEATVANHETMLQLHEREIKGLSILSKEVKRVDGDVKKLSEEVHITHTKIVAHLASIDVTLKEIRKSSIDNKSIIEILEKRISSVETQKKTALEILASLVTPISVLVIAVVVAYVMVFDSKF